MPQTNRGTLPSSSRRQELKSKRLNKGPDVAPSRNPIPTKNPDGSYTIRVERKHHWSKKDFRRKVGALMRASDANRLTRKPDGKKTRSGTMQNKSRDQFKKMFQRDRDGAVKDAERRHARGAISDQERGRLVQEADDLHQRQLDRFKTKEADHFVELQLDGADALPNLGPIENVTNHGMGVQIRSQLAHVPDGARVYIEVLKW